MGESNSVGIFGKVIPKRKKKTVKLLSSYNTISVCRHVGTLRRISVNKLPSLRQNSLIRHQKEILRHLQRRHYRRLHRKRANLVERVKRKSVFLDSVLNEKRFVQTKMLGFKIVVAQVELIIRTSYIYSLTVNRFCRLGGAVRRVVSVVKWVHYLDELGNET